MATGEKAPDAFRTIGELSAELGVPQHVLRYWETRFPQLKPLQRAGNRRYYRAADIALARRIHHLLSEQGYTVRGVQKLLGEKLNALILPTPSPVATPSRSEQPGIDIGRLVVLRDRLRDALAG